jgi:prevent-host-death family protein
MPNIKPVSDLRNYNEVLVECEVGNPVFITKNGRGKYVIIDIKEYEKQQATLKLMSKLAESENMPKSGDDWLDFDELKNHWRTN